MQWQDRLSQRMLPVPYAHVTFTCLEEAKMAPQQLFPENRATGASEIDTSIPKKA